MTIHQVKVQKINHTQFVDDHASDRFSGPESSYPRWYRGSFLATNDWDTQSCVIRTPTNLTRSEASRRHDYDFLLPIDEIHTGLNSFDDPALAHSRFPQKKQTELLALGFAVGMVFPGQRLR